MATLHFSQNITNVLFNGNLTGHMIRSSTSGTNIYNIGGTGNASDSVLEIYQGTVASFPSFTDASQRSADLLISFTLTNPNSSTVLLNNSYRQLIGRRLIDTPATASGVATWFLLRRTNTTSLTTSGGMIGTVGILGSGADLEVPNTSIVQGQNYQCAGFTMSWPLSRTV